MTKIYELETPQSIETLFDMPYKQAVLKLEPL